MFDSRAASGLAGRVRASNEPADRWGEGYDRLSDHLSEAELAEFWARQDAEPLFDSPGTEEPLGCSMANVEPSGWLALELDSGTADPRVLSDRHLIDGIVGFDRTASWSAARQARLLAEMSRRADNPAPGADPVGLGPSLIADEVAVALSVSRGTAAARLHQAERLAEVLPATLAEWESGRIDTAKVRAIHDATAVLSDDHAQAVEARVLPRAPQLSVPQLRDALARAILAVDPSGAAERHREARRGRRVCLGQETEGMASLWALLTAPVAAGAYEWLTRLARGLGADDPRTMDARRADLMGELLNGRLVTDADITVVDDADQPDDAAEPASNESAEAGAPDTSATDGSAAAPGQRKVPLRPVTPGKPLIQVVMPHSTLIGADDQPADLTGYGPIPADLAREIAADAVWRRLVTDPLSGTVLDYGRTTYRPPAGLADHVRARDRYCRGPLCRHKAADSELDHAVAWADGGETSETNLHAFCKHDHLLKHHGRWRIEAHSDGQLTWITPAGLRHTTTPYDYRPEADPTEPTGSPPAPPEPVASDPDPPPF